MHQDQELNELTLDAYVLDEEFDQSGLDVLYSDFYPACEESFSYEFI